MASTAPALPHGKEDPLWQSAAAIAAARSGCFARTWTPGAVTGAGGSFNSDWAQVPDTVLLQAILCISPGDICATAKCCRNWAETVTQSEAWLWSVVGLAGLPSDISVLLERWASAVRLGLRHAIQLWMCRAHLWAGSPWTGVEAYDPVVTVPCGAEPCEVAAVCCAAWLGGGTGGAEPGGGPGLATGFADGVLSFCRLATALAPVHGLRGYVFTGTDDVATVRAAHGHSHITALQPVSRVAPVLVSGGLDGLLRFWDPATGQEVAQVVSEQQRGINSVAVSQCDAPRLVCCGDDGLAFLYDTAAQTGARPLQGFRGHTAAAYCAAWTSPQTFATGGFDRRTLVWDCRAPAAPALVLPARQHVYALAPFGGSADLRVSIAVGLADGAVSQFDLRGASREPVRELRGHGGAVEALAVLPGDVLASASVDGTLRLWDGARKGEAAWVWDGGGPLTAVCAVSEDALLVAGLRTPPTLLALDYGRAAPHVPEVLDRLQMPTLRPWKRASECPPEGHGRHSALLHQRRLQRGSTRSSATAPSSVQLARMGSATRGAFDRCVKSKPIQQGATGTAHRTFLFGSGPR